MSQQMNAEASTQHLDECTAHIFQADAPTNLPAEGVCPRRASWASLAMEQMDVDLHRGFLNEIPMSDLRELAAEELCYPWGGPVLCVTGGPYQVRKESIVSHIIRAREWRRQAQSSPGTTPAELAPFTMRSAGMDSGQLVEGGEVRSLGGAPSAGSRDRWGAQ